MKALCPCLRNHSWSSLDYTFNYKKRMFIVYVSESRVMLICRIGHNAKNLVFLVNNVYFRWEIPTNLFVYFQEIKLH